jgi:hypothetical protein
MLVNVWWTGVPGWVSCIAKTTWPGRLAGAGGWRMRWRQWRVVAEYAAAPGAEDEPVVVVGCGYLQDARRPGLQDGGNAASGAGLAGEERGEVGGRCGQERHRVRLREQGAVVIAEDGHGWGVDDPVAVAVVVRLPYWSSGSGASGEAYIQEGAS